MTVNRFSASVVIAVFAVDVVLGAPVAPDNKTIILAVCTAILVVGLSFLAKRIVRARQ